VGARIKAGIRYTMADIWQGHEVRLTEWDWSSLIDHAIRPLPMDFLAARLFIKIPGKMLQVLRRSAP